MIILSTGFSHFHLKAAAAEVQRNGILATLLAGAYPTEGLKSFLQKIGLASHPKILRLLSREEPDLVGKVNPAFLPEALAQLGIFLRRFENLPIKSFNDWIIRLSFKWYGNWAARQIARKYSSAKVYHYRAGYGGRSVQVAKELGMVALCDHSIIHPDLLDYFVEHQGQWPEPGHSGSIDLLWRYIKSDIEQADHVVVNSDFVKESFLHMGWDKNIVHALYWGIDDSFIQSLPEIGFGQENDINEVSTFVFAGYFGASKLCSGFYCLR